MLVANSAFKNKTHTWLTATESWQITEDVPSYNNASENICPVNSTYSLIEVRKNGWCSLREVIANDFANNSKYWKDKVTCSNTFWLHLQNQSNNSRKKDKKEHRKSVNVSYMQRKGCRLRTRVHIRQSNDFKITAEQSDS